MRTRTLGGVSASGKIAKQAEKDPDREVSEDVELMPRNFKFSDVFSQTNRGRRNKRGSRTFATK